MGREAAVRSVGTKERLIKRDPPVGRSLSAPWHTAVGTRPNFRPALIRDSALTRDLDTESERTASTADSELPATGSTRRLFRMSRRGPAGHTQVGAQESVIRLDPLLKLGVFKITVFASFKPQLKQLMVSRLLFRQRSSIFSSSSGVSVFISVSVFLPPLAGKPTKTCPPPSSDTA